MGQLVDTRLRALDSSGNPLNGAKLFIYNASTVTPTTLYSDQALTVSLANPVTADSAGAFPQVYAAEGTIVDMTLKDSSGNTIRSYTNVTLVGSDTGDLTRTVSGSGRFKITGSAGSVLLQAGDPSPDNVGGSLVIEGWSGTQLDTLDLDAALTRTSGRFQENSLYLPGILQANTPTTFTAAANVDIPLTNSPAGLRAWDIDLFDLTFSGALSVQFRLSYDGGVTYKSGATDYAYANLFNETVTPTSASSTGAATMVLGDGSDTAPTSRGFIRIRLITVNSGTDATVIQATANLYDSGGTPAPKVVLFSGYGLGGYGRATHLRFLPSGGTATGKYRVARAYGFGE